MAAIAGARIVGRLAGNLYRNPNTKRFFKQALYRTGQAIKRRRTYRINNRLPYAGRRIREKLLKSGVSLPIRGVTTTPMAVNLGNSAVSRNKSSAIRSGIETNLPVAGSTATTFTTGIYNATGTFNCKIYPLLPADTNLWPALAAFAASWNYWKWIKTLTVTFTTQSPTSAGGKIGLAICPSYLTATLLTDWNDFEALPNKTIGSVFTNQTLKITPDMMNTQFINPDTGFMYQDMGGNEYNESQLNQGFLVVAVTDCATAASIGKLSLQYECMCMRSIAPDGSYALTDIWYDFEVGGVADIATHAYTNAISKATHYTNVIPAYTAATTAGGVTTVTGGTRHPYIVSIHVFGAAFPTLALAAVTGCTVTHMISLPSTDGTLHTYHHVVVPNTPGHTFTITQTNNATHVLVRFSPLRRSLAAAVVDWSG